MAKIFNLFFLFSIYSSVIGKPATNNFCCNSYTNDDRNLEHINYNCSDLTAFGRNRCNKIFGGNVCLWNNGETCQDTILKGCNRISYFEQYGKELIDVGKCSGLCKEDNKLCSPNNVEIREIVGIQGEPQSIKIIKDCDCDKCGTLVTNQVIEVPIGKCHGDCSDGQSTNLCLAGLEDQYSLSNGQEVSNPSLLLLSGILNQCSAGIQTGFDIFIDNRCFGHTFTDCFINSECPLRKANLRICMQAAQVSLTNTDSLILGVNGIGYWSQNLGVLNGGQWNPNDSMCLDLDLNNLPGGVSILNLVDSVGHLDVTVQDDTAVDFVHLDIAYERCQECIPSDSVIHTLYTDNGINEHVNVKNCDCVDSSKCLRAKNEITYYPKTLYEYTIDVGQCNGRCPKGKRCVPNEVSLHKIKAPEGVRVIQIIKSCYCRKIKWNNQGK